MTAQYLPVLLLIPLFLCLLIRKLSPDTISLKEVLIQFVAGAIFVAVSFWVIIHLSISNTVYLNGEVTKKQREKVSCSHSYQVCVGTGENRICTTHYHHPYDFDYRVYTTVGTLTIPTIDSQGLKVPPRFDQVVIGEHAATTSSFSDFLEGNRNSLHKRNINSITPIHHRKPDVFDYYRLHKYVSDIPIMPEVSSQITELAKTHLSHKNVIYFFSTASESMRYSLMMQWYISLNDIIILVGLDNDYRVSWIDALTYGDNFKNGSLGANLSYGTIGKQLTPELINKIDSSTSKYYQRPSEKDLKYLAVNMEVSLGQWIAIFILNLLFNGLVGYYMHRNEL